MKLRVLIVTLAVTLISVALSVADPATPPAPNPDEIIARVSGTEIKRRDLDVATKALQMQLAQQGRGVAREQFAQFERDMLDELIGRELVLQAARTQDLPDIDVKVKEQMERIKTQLGGEEAMTKTFRETGVTPAEYTKRLRDNIIVQESVQRMVEEKSKVTADEIQSFYNSNTNRFLRPETTRASHILIRLAPDASEETKQAKRAQIEAARSLIKGGGKFADVAGKVSEDPGSARNGGDLGYFVRGQMVPEFELAAYSLKLNELSDVITTQFGYHVLMVTDRKPPEQQSFATVKADIEKFLRYRKGGEVARQHVQDLRVKAKVEVLLAPLPAAPKSEAPKTDVPKTDPPKMDGPKTEAPKP